VIVTAERRGSGRQLPIRCDGMEFWGVSRDGEIRWVIYRLGQRRTAFGGQKLANGTIFGREGRVTTTGQTHFQYLKFYAGEIAEPDSRWIRKRRLVATLGIDVHVPCIRRIWFVCLIGTST